MVPIVAFKDLQGAINALETRGWKFIEHVPSQKRLLKSFCCDQIRLGKVGKPIQMQFMPSDLQADSDDAHNFGDVYDQRGKRLYVENKIDWIAVTHFCEPAVHIDLNELKDSRPTEKDGFVSPENLPKEYLEKSERFKS